MTDRDLDMACFTNSFSVLSINRLQEMANAMLAVASSTATLEGSGTAAETTTETCYRIESSTHGPPYELLWQVYRSEKQ